MSGEWDAANIGGPHLYNSKELQMERKMNLSIHGDQVFIEEKNWHTKTSYAVLTLLDAVGMGLLCPSGTLKRMQGDSAPE